MREGEILPSSFDAASAQVRTDARTQQEANLDVYPHHIDAASRHAIAYLHKEKLLRVHVPDLGLKVPFGVVGSLEGLALLGLPTAPDHHKGITKPL